MISEDKGFIAMLAMGILGLVLLFFCVLLYADYTKSKMELEQPRYFIEFKGNVYELKEVE